ELGLAVAGIGDVNADGRSDFAVGAPAGADSTKVGEVRAFLGRAAPVSSPDTVWFGEAGGDMFGRMISNGGRVDAGLHDLFLIGSYLHSNAGRAYLFGSGTASVAVPDEVDGAGIRLLAPWPDP